MKITLLVLASRDHPDGIHHHRQKQRKYRLDLKSARRCTGLSVQHDSFKEDLRTRGHDSGHGSSCSNADRRHARRIATPDCLHKLLQLVCVCLQLLMQCLHYVVPSFHTGTLLPLQMTCCSSPASQVFRVLRSSLHHSMNSATSLL